jgi:hypothetical protein
MAACPNPQTLNPQPKPPPGENSTPTVFLGALWLPYSRDLDLLRSTMSQVLGGGQGEGERGGKRREGELRARQNGQWMDGVGVGDGGGGGWSEVGPQTVGTVGPQTVFCHVDVIGADMSGGMSAERGLLVSDFPPHVRVYTGHYHKPHELWADGDVARWGKGRQGRTGGRQHPVTYIGSQWQTNMGEALEEKRLLVLDSSRGWAVCEEIPVVVGRRHFRATSLHHLAANLAAWAPKEG